MFNSKTVLINNWYSFNSNYSILGILEIRFQGILQCKDKYSIINYIFCNYELHHIKGIKIHVVQSKNYKQNDNYSEKFHQNIILGE